MRSQLSCTHFAICVLDDSLTIARKGKSESDSVVWPCVKVKHVKRNQYTPMQETNFRMWMCTWDIGVNPCGNCGSDFMLLSCVNIIMWICVGVDQAAWLWIHGRLQFSKTCRCSHLFLWIHDTKLETCCQKQLYQIYRSLQDGQVLTMACVHVNLSWAPGCCRHEFWI